MPARTAHNVPQNPRYDIFVTEDGRRKKLKKSLPPGLSAHDERVLKTVQRKAYRYEWWIGMLLCRPLPELPHEFPVWECLILCDEGDLSQPIVYIYCVYLCDEIED